MWKTGPRLICHSEGYKLYSSSQSNSCFTEPRMAAHSISLACQSSLVTVIHRAIQPSPLSLSSLRDPPKQTKANPLLLPRAFHSPAPETTTLSLSLYLSKMDMSHRWNYMMGTLSCLTSYTWHNVSGVHLCNVLVIHHPIGGWVIFHHINKLHFIYLLVS